MSIEDETRAEAVEALDRLTQIALDNTSEDVHEAVYEDAKRVRAEWQASRKGEAAPSDTDKEALAWVDRHNDVWIFPGAGDIGYSFETQPFSLEHIERKWGPLEPLSRTSRPVQVEPTFEEWAAEVAAERSRHPEKGYTAEHDRKHGLKHLANWAIDYARCGKGVKSSSMVLALLEAAEWVQVEVTDEMVEKAAKVLYSDYARDYEIAPWSLAVRGSFISLAHAALESALGGEHRG